MSYEELRTTALYWRQAARLEQRIKGSMAAHAKNGRPSDLVLPEVLDTVERRLKALEKKIWDCCAGEPWLVRVRQVLEEQPGFGTTHAIVCGLIPPLVQFPNPAKLWKWLSAEPPGQPRALDRAATGFLRAIALFRSAQTVMQNRTTPWRELWDARRAHTAGTHPEWSKQHSLLDAHRYVSKRMWLVLWRAAHGLPLNMPVASDQGLSGTHENTVASDQCSPVTHHLPVAGDQQTAVTNTQTVASDQPTPVIQAKTVASDHARTVIQRGSVASDQGKPVTHKAVVATDHQWSVTQLTAVASDQRRTATQRTSVAGDQIATVTHLATVAKRPTRGRSSC